MDAPKLVVLEDDKPFAQRVVDFAADSGFDAAVAPSVAEFMEQFDATRPSVIVMELVLQEQDGLELIRWLLSQGSAAHLVVITGYSRSYARAAEMLVNARGGMSITVHDKPIDDEALKSVLTAALPAGDKDSG